MLAAEGFDGGGETLSFFEFEFFGVALSEVDFEDEGGGFVAPGLGGLVLLLGVGLCVCGFLFGVFVVFGFVVVGFGVPVSVLLGGRGGGAAITFFLLLLLLLLAWSFLGAIILLLFLPVLCRGF